jgi:hypothetical protein
LAQQQENKALLEVIKDAIEKLQMNQEIPNVLPSQS